MCRISVKQGTVCPLCPDHQDDEFVWSDIAQEPICIGCGYELEFGLQFASQPTNDEYSHAGTVSALLSHLGITYSEARRRSLIAECKYLGQRKIYESNLIRERISRKKQLHGIDERLAEITTKLQHYKPES